MINSVTLVGRLGDDVELRYTQSGVPFGRLSVATNSTYKDRDGNLVKKTDWHRVLVFQKTAENCANYLGKGSLIYLEGSLSTRKWTDREGIERFITEVTARRIKFLDHKKSEATPVDDVPQQLQEEQGDPTLLPTVDQYPF